MWPSDPEAQAYAVLMLALALAVVGLIGTVMSERRYWRRKLSRIGERHHERTAGLRNDLAWALSEIERLRPVEPQSTLVEHWRTTPTWAATRSAEQTIVADAAIAAADITTRIHAADYDGGDTP
jgi:hypothetical protein